MVELLVGPGLLAAFVVRNRLEQRPGVHRHLRVAHQCRRQRPPGGAVRRRRLEHLQLRSQRLAQAHDETPADLVHTTCRQLDAPVKNRERAVGGEAEFPEAVPGGFQLSGDEDEGDVTRSEGGDSCREEPVHAFGSTNCGSDRKRSHSAKRFSPDLCGDVADQPGRVLAVEEALDASRRRLAAIDVLHPLPLQDVWVLNASRAIRPATTATRLVALHVPHALLEAAEQVELGRQPPWTVQKRCKFAGLQRLPSVFVGLVQR
mmetsp:Transcript_60698/g.154252  ORF Transcript_60698/g.154252 Transcript_60698/m.154252 type:complete len:261 (+) Transcript_60698:728-1510(+)